MRRLARQARHYPELRIGTVDTQGLSERDAGLARIIEDTVIRRWITLAWILEQLGGKPLGELEPKMRAVLLAGAAQILFLDRVPDHAAIDESVSWAKRSIRPGAGGMVNAVLRKVAAVRAERRESWQGGPDELPLADGGAIGLTRALLPEDERQRLPLATGMPAQALDRWQAIGARHMGVHALVRAPVILNVAHAKTPVPETNAGGTDMTAHERAGHAVFTGAPGALGRVLSARDDVWVQDPASSGAVESVADLSVRTVVDLCAGKGTKTRQLRATFPEARIVATDVDAERYAVLRGVFADDERVEVMPIARVRETMGESADLVVLDVPCSNTGVLARRPEARHRVGPGAIERLQGVQRQIIADAIPVLSPGGAILYATCSVEREENEDQAAWAAQWHGVCAERERRETPAGAPGEPASGYHDGAYSVVLRR